MNLRGQAPCLKVGELPPQLVEDLRAALATAELVKTYYEVNKDTKAEGWVRSAKGGISDHNPLMAHQAFRDLRAWLLGCKLFDNEELLLIGISRVSPHSEIFYHVDSELIYRLQSRVLIPITYPEGCTNTSISNDKEVMFDMHVGSVYRFNDSILHKALNPTDQNRDVVFLNLQHKRLQEKFADHPDLVRRIGGVELNNKHANSHANIDRVKLLQIGRAG